ncbi:MurR/RpiR family transcriptional regulator [Agrobacterium rhizogenes]|uniref:MurR/RpiR family transcriptional regulator n=1 Tax=Rhizobium rhizogenes TaxID=359 RepID=UPI00157270CF|nr:SIS domain-containing protein [Rhizobium rhizogenes]NTI19881.1 MurR/RpiR family transcriptional regulator [Rhizobium rhizogenes]
MTIKDILSGNEVKLTSAEKKAVRALLGNYPAAGLGTVAGFASRAGVSVPTILRLVTKLGYGGYAAFQKDLIEDVSEQLNSPLSMIDTRAAAAGSDDIYVSIMHNLTDALRQTAAAYRKQDFDALLDLLSDERLAVYCIGGRFSSVLAQRLWMHLSQLRPGVSFIETLSARLFDRVIDFNSQTTLIVFDYRRYQSDVVEFARLAKEARARIVLFTDRWMSPISNFADHVLVSPVETLSAYDSKVVAFAQCEAIIASLVKRSPDKIRERLATIEALRRKGETQIHQTEVNDDKKT